MRKILLLLFFLCSFLTFSSSVANTAAGQGILDAIRIPAGGTGCSYKNDGKTPFLKCADNSTCVFSTTHYDSNADAYIGGYCSPNQAKCPICASGYQYSYSALKCVNLSNSLDLKAPDRIADCKAGESCAPGYGCGVNQALDQPLSTCPDGTCQTAIGNLPTSIQGLLQTIFSVALAIAGAAVVLLIIVSGYKLMFSQGNPDQIKDAREQLTAAIVGLLFIIFSLVLLQVIGVNLLGIPGFSG